MPNRCVDEVDHRRDQLGGILRGGLIDSVVGQREPNRAGALDQVYRRTHQFVQSSRGEVRDFKDVDLVALQNVKVGLDGIRNCLAGIQVES